jgi:hypothetical protein
MRQEGSYKRAMSPREQQGFPREPTPNDNARGPRGALQGTNRHTTLTSRLDCGDSCGWLGLGENFRAEMARTPPRRPEGKRIRNLGQRVILLYLTLQKSLCFRTGPCCERAEWVGLEQGDLGSFGLAEEGVHFVQPSPPVHCSLAKTVYIPIDSQPNLSCVFTFMSLLPARKAHHKSKSGCASCKRRRIKVGEQYGTSLGLQLIISPSAMKLARRARIAQSAAYYAASLD